VTEKQYLAEVVQNQRGSTPPDCVAHSALALAKLCGAKFDPEEEPLPERLDVNLGASAVIEHGRLDGDEVVLVIAGSYRGIPGQSEAQRVAREVVRRWNTWPELRRAVDGLGLSSGIRQRVLAILDGKEGE
jgi:hypothetical protein